MRNAVRNAAATTTPSMTAGAIKIRQIHFTGLLQGHANDTGCCGIGISRTIPVQAARFERQGRGRSNLYLVLLDYEDSPRGPYGVYVGVTQYAPSVRFDQHKAGIRAAGSVLKRGLEVLTGPVLHLQGVKRAQAEEIEEGLAEALRAEGLMVQGGH